jgi:hypothetical protein
MKLDKVETSPEFKRFDVALRKVLAVPHEGLQRREAEWKKQRKRKKRAKS